MADFDLFSTLMDLADKGGRPAQDTPIPEHRRKLTLRFTSVESRRKAADRIVATGLLRVSIAAKDLEDDDAR